MGQKYEMEGQLVEVCDLLTFPSGFTKREFVINDDKSGKYENLVKFTVAKDACKICDGLRVGEVYKVEFFIDGRRFEGQKGKQYFIDLSARNVYDSTGKKVTGDEGEVISSADDVKDWDTLRAFALVHGEDEASLKARGGKYCKAHGYASATSCKREDWVAIAKEIAAEYGSTIDSVTTDDLPF
jgi:single-strand DNA-binding protein